MPYEALFMKGLFRIRNMSLTTHFSSLQGVRIIFYYGGRNPGRNRGSSSALKTLFTDANTDQECPFAWKYGGADKNTLISGPISVTMRATRVVGNHFRGYQHWTNPNRY
ncbi:hypothetical protein KC19_7G056300 [Ceratodon purpureus]|uniref:Uncharacterized protein n=1 Tax=Ceratodon purpureus TaxID=3225 RepID=A0A8T0H2M0_CERPU|nr:hypothetical protein KC19_7G056300 [Ceratodon purpureus]